MRYSVKKLLGQNVVTESGLKLGVVRDIEVQSDSHQAQSFLVGPRFGWRGLLAISPPLVKQVTEQGLVVYDSVVRADTALNRRPAFGATPAAASSITTK